MNGQAVKEKLDVLDIAWKVVCTSFAVVFVFWLVTTFLEYRTADAPAIVKAAAASECARQTIAGAKPVGEVRAELYTQGDAWSFRDLRVIADACAEEKAARVQIASLNAH